jgi:hypothetical protein
MIRKIGQKLFTKYENFKNKSKIEKYLLSPKEYHDRLDSIRNKFKGQRCFILGNGPSLNKCDLKLLASEYSFAVNGIFYKTDEMGFKPTFYVVEDNHVVADNLKRINSYRCQYKFFPAQYRNIIVPDENTLFIPMDMGFYREHHPYYCMPRFSVNVEDVIYAGQSVTIMNLQLAYHLGFKYVYLIGMDFHYKLPESTIVEGCNYTSQEDDPNHFHKDYFGKGKKWHDPKLDRVLLNYQVAKEVFEKDKRRIFNATVGGKLELFERVDYYSLFS